MRRHQQNGFTLIEMMVVLVVIGIIVSTMVLSIKTDDITEHMETEMHRLHTLVTLAQEEAILQGQMMALAISEDRYRFEIYDVKQETWSVLSDARVFRERKIVPGTILVLVIDEFEKETKKDFKLELSEDEQQDENLEDDEFQRVQIEPSGEIYPFELFIRKEDESVEFKLVMSEDGELKVVLPDETG